MVAADFIRNLRDEVRKGQRGRLKQGLYPFCAPRGYLNCGKGKPKKVDPIVGPLVREAFELYSSRTFSLHQLRREMARRGLRSARGGTLCLTAISNLLHNPFYCGLIRIRSSGESYEGVHEPIVSRALFNRVQAVLSGRLYPRIEKHTFRFRRLIKCCRCGRSLTGERQKGRVYYRCHDLGCRGVSVSEEVIEQVVCENLGALCLDARDVGDFRDILRGAIAQDESQHEERLERVGREIGLVEERLARLTDALLDGTIDKESFDARKERLIARRLELRDLAEGRTTLTIWPELAELFELGFVALPSYQSGNDHEKRRILQCVSSNLLLDRNRLQFPMRFPFEELRNWSTEQGGAPRRNAVRTTTRDRRSVKLRRFMRLLAKTRGGGAWKFRA